MKINLLNLKNFKFRNFKEEIDFFSNFRDISLSFVLLLSWFNWIGKMWSIGVMKGKTPRKTRPNAKLSVSGDGFIIKIGLRSFPYMFRSRETHFNLRTYDHESFC